MSYSQRAKNAPTAKVTSKSAQKSEQPAHTKPFKFENEKGRVEKQEDDWRPGKRMNITAQDTGRIQNKTIVSTESPDWMKSFFENNRAYFEKQGVAQKLKKQGPPGESPAGVPSSAREKGKKPGTQMTCDETGILFSQTMGSANSPDWMDNPWKPPAAAHTPRRVGQRAGIDRHTANPTPRAKSANEMQHLLVSDSVPPWMKSSTVVEAMAKGCGSARRTGEQDDSRAAGVTTERFWDESSRNKGGNMIHPATGRVLHKAHQSDDFPLDSGRNHRAAFEETMRQRPQSARAQGPHYAGDRSKEFRDKAKGAVVDQLTGKVANSSIVSPESPQWMKEPFENNRQYFQNKGVAQKLRALSAEELRDTGFIAGRPVPVRARQVHKQITNEAGRVQNMSIVSRTAPDWMKSPFESNRTYFENAGIAQSKELPRSRSAPPSKTPAASPEPLEAPPLLVDESPGGYGGYGAIGALEKAKETDAKPAKGVPCHAEQRSERRRKSASEVSSTSRRSSSAASATYSARHQKSRTRSLSSVNGPRG